MSFVGRKNWQVFRPTKDVPDCFIYLCLKMFPALNQLIRPELNKEEDKDMRVKKPPLLLVAFIFNTATLLAGNLNAN